MSNVYFSYERILSKSEDKNDIEPKLVFYQYRYDFSYSKITDMMKKGQFAFVNFHKGEPTHIELSPTYRTILNIQNIKNAEINQKKGDKFIKTLVKIDQSDLFNIDHALELYNQKCIELILEKI